jgi:hypothetical protein
MSCEKYFLKGHKVHYFVFTDGALAHVRYERVTGIEQPNLGWPNNTLKRFHMFSRVLDKLAAFDFAFFLNANCEFRNTIDESILPFGNEELVVVQHPGYFDKQPDQFPYDRDPASCASIPFGEGRHYACGGINGGRSDAYCAMIEALRNATDIDEKNGVVALWHDESHLNRYIVGKKYKLLSPAYFYPENWQLPFEEIIRVRDKNLLGGHNFFRGIKDKPDDQSRIFESIRNRLKGKMNL